MDSKYYMHVVGVNGEDRKHLESKPFDIEHICKGGFRFITDELFELEDRVRVKLSMPDDRTEIVLGRICYSDMIDNDRMVYGFSILDGFYSLDRPVTNNAAVM